MGATAEALALPRDPLAYDITVNGEGDEAKLAFAIASTTPGGVLTQVGIFASDQVTPPLRTMYGGGLSFHTGRVQARAELPAVLAHCAHGDFRPGVVTSRVVSFSEAAEAMLDPGPKVVFSNDWDA
jgi:alcohol dehydrogenase